MSFKSGAVVQEAGDVEPALRGVSNERSHGTSIRPKSPSDVAPPQ
jgi:hypothetical protein